MSVTTTTTPAPRDRGFTLVEVVVAIVLVGILSAVVVVGVGRLTESGTAASCAASADAARAAATVHFASSGSHASTFADLTGSGSLVLPESASVSGNMMTAGGWRLVMTAGTPPVFTCVGAVPVSGAVAQFDSMDSSLVVRDVGGSVTQWRSVTGSRTLVPRSGVAAATYDTTGFNGRPAVTTNGASVLVDTGLSLPGDATVVALARPIGTPQRVISSVSNNWLLGWWGGYEDLAHFDNWVGAFPGPSAAGPHLYSTVIDRGVQADVFKDGVLLKTSTTATTTPAGLSIGGWGTGGERSVAAVAEVIVFDRVLTTAERQAVERYLSTKWGHPVA